MKTPHQAGGSIVRTFTPVEIHEQSASGGGFGGDAGDNAVWTAFAIGCGWINTVPDSAGTELMDETAITNTRVRPSASVVLHHPSEKPPEQH